MEVGVTGWSVSISNDGNTVAIGAPFSGNNGGNSGTARIYKYDGETWIQSGNDINGEAELNEFGQTVALSGDGNRVAIGAPRNNDAGILAGHVRVFEDLFVSVSNDFEKNKIELHPNPTTGKIFVDGNIIEDRKIRIMDSMGKTIKRYKSIGEEIDLSKFPSGLYFLSISFQDQTIVKKIIKN